MRSRSGVLTLCFFLLFFAGLVRAAAATLHGTVKDPQGSPVSGAAVQLLNPQGEAIAHTASDAQGSFRFENLGAGQYTVQVSLAGFRTVNVSAATGEPARITLAIAPLHENVVVTATRTETPVSELGASTTVITRGEMLAEDANFLGSILRSVPGVAVVRNGAPGAVTSVFVRGGDSDYNKVLLDGIPLNEPGGDFDFSIIPTDNLSRVEVVRSADSALFGTDAMTSVIQLFTRRGNPEMKRPHFTISGEGGKNSTWRGGGALTGGYGRLDYSLEGEKFSTANQIPNDFFHVVPLTANIGYRLNDATVMRVILAGQFGLNGTPGQTAFGPPDRDGQHRRRDGYGAFSIQNQTTASWDQQILYTYSRKRQVSIDLGTDPTFTPSFDGHVAAFPYFDFASNFLNDQWRDHASYQSTWRGAPFGGRFGHHVDTFAFDWDGEHGFLADRFSQDPATSARRNNYGYTFQDQMLWGRWSLGNGVRIEDNGSFGTVVVPRDSVAYRLRRGNGFFGATRLKFNFGLGVKEPTFLESFSNTPFFKGNPNLAPEHARTLDYGVEQRFWGDRAELDLDGFDNRFRDQIAFETTNFQTFAGTFFNIGRAMAKGGEAILKLEPLPGIRANASYTYLDSEVLESGSPFTPAEAVGRWLLRRPRHSGSVQVFWNWKRMTISSITDFVGRRQDSDFLGLEPPIIWNDGYVNSNLAWSFRTRRKITYYGIIENLFNQEYQEILGYPALKRTFRAGVRLEF